MTNIIERTLELLAFALLIAGAIAFWYVTPAHAETYSYQDVDTGNGTHFYYNDRGDSMGYTTEDQFGTQHYFNGRSYCNSQTYAGQTTVTCN